MRKSLKFIKNNWTYCALALILVLAIFVRTYNFEEFLYFRSDQVRDAKLAQAAFENGPEELPLLGPRAAGTYLRLGPAFYYMQYLSAEIFSSDKPQVFAYPDLFFSILTIPLLFLFLNNFFFKKQSLFITVLYSFSFIIIQYSRFAWNPNSIPFWGLLFLHSIYKTYKEENKKKAGWWLIVAGASLAVVSQLHFMAFVGFPAVAFLFWLIHRPKNINWRYWLGALMALVIIYIPVILSDFKTGGDNFRQFMYAITVKTDRQEFGLIGSIKQIVISFFMFLTSFGHSEGKVSAFLGGLLVLFGLGFLGYFWKKEKKSRPFIWLVLVWFLVFVVLQIKTATSLKPRFFMPIAAMPFLFWGLFLKFAQYKKTRFFGAGVLLSFVFILLMNINGIKIAYSYFKTQDPAKVTRNIFIKQDDAKTLGQIKKTSGYMSKEAQKNDKWICFYADATYRRSYEYVFAVYYPEVGYDRISKSAPMAIKNNCQYFAISGVSSKNILSSRYEDYFEFVSREDFGQIAVWNMTAKENYVNYNKEERDKREEKDEREEEIAEEDSSEEEMEEMGESDSDSEDNDDEVDAPRRLDRVFWKDVLN